MSRSTLFDLTKRKKMEQQLRELNQNLTKVNEDKNNFLGIASHDLKNPLHSIFGIATLMKLDSANFTKNQHEYLTMIFDTINKMNELIDQLLDVSRIEQGKALTQKKEVDLVSLVSQTADSFQVQATNKNIQLLFNDHPSSLSASTDSTVLNQILENLISNALKFSPQNKKITIHLRPTHDRAIIDVSDEGPGIKPEEFPRLFGKFQRLSARPTAGENSTGLGLSIVKELVQALDGKISCQSRVGVGTTFTVNLPLH
jgi:signal transduction histidine kinase